MMRRWTLWGVVCMVTLAASSAVAQDAPYSPLQPVRAKLVTNGRFETSPLKLPFNQVSVRTVPDGEAVHFEHVYSATSQEILAVFLDQQANQAGFTLFDPKIYPASSGERFRVIGSQARKEGGMELRFASQSVSRDFRLQIYDVSGKAHVKLINLVLTSPTSGVGPARVGFRPLNLQTELPFRWN